MKKFLWPVLLAVLLSSNSSSCALSGSERATDDSAADGSQKKNSGKVAPRQFRMGGDDYPLYSD
jgi:hypothetical protein